MNKTTKSGLIWGGTLLGLGGVAAAIAVPIVLNSKKVTKTNPLTNFDPKAEVMEGLTGEQLLAALDKTGIADTSLLSKTQYQLAFYLYDKEQKGSVEYQREFLKWDQYSINKNLQKLLTETLSVDDKTPITAEQSLHDTLVGKAQTAIDAIDANTDKDKKNSAQSTLDNYKKDFAKKVTLLAALPANNIVTDSVYSSSSFASDYPKMLLPIKNIRDKQDKIYEDQKSAFIGSYKGTADGNSEWQKQLSAKFGGATNKSQAIDYLVNQQVSSSAWAKYSYSMNSSFTWEQYKSGIFTAILGDFKDDANKADRKVVVKTETADNKRTDGDKVYFFGSASKDTADNGKWINLSGNHNVPNDFNHVYRLQNAILGFKQDTTDPLKAWTVTKPQLTNLFKMFGKDNKLPVDQLQYLFHEMYSTQPSGGPADKEAAEELTKNLIAHFTDTTDSTQFKSGDLGYTTPAQYLSGSVFPGFAIGTASALDALTATSTGVTNPVHVGGHVDAPDFLKNLMASLKTEFVKLWANYHGVADPFAGSFTSSEASTRNNLIADFITNLKDEQIAEFGKIIRDAFFGVQGTSGALNGLVGAIRIDGATGAEKANKGIFVINADEAGTHVIKIDWLGGNGGQAVIDAMNTEMQAAADKQDSKELKTDWAKFISNSTSKPKQMLELLLTKNTSGNGYDFTNQDFINFMVSNQASGTNWYKETFNYDTEDAFKKDIADLLSTIVQSEQLSRVQSTYADKTFTWLEGKIDNKLWAQPDATGHAAGVDVITPEEIYQAVLNGEGI